MARTIRNAKLDTRSARAKLPARREPYWVMISKGCAVGYRKGRHGGSWIARFRDDVGKQHYRALGAADDAMDVSGDLCLDYARAQRAADSWFKLAARGFENEAPRSGPYTVRDALADYMASYRRRGKAADRMQWSIDGHILPALGATSLHKLSRRQIEAWHEALAEAPPRLRTRPGRPQRFRAVDNSPEARRRRRSTANRILNILKAALNHAHHEHRLATDDAWRSVRPFREADAARVRYLKDHEARRLVESCVPSFRPLVQAALLTGCRYGELKALVAADYDAEAGTIHVRVSKSGKARHVALTEEGQAFFASMTAGASADAVIFTKPDASPWGASHQQRPFKAACKEAAVGTLTFHELRHTYASRLVMGGVPLAVVAHQLGHSDTRMVEKHYGHLCKNYVADTVRTAFGPLGIVQPHS